MCDDYNALGHRPRTGGAIFTGCTSRSRELFPVCADEAGARVVAELVLLADVFRRRSRDRA
jgi:hypothetical protein